MTGDPATFTLTISDDGSISQQFDADTGSATPSSNIINLFGTSAQGLSTSATGNTVTFTNLDASTSQKGVAELSTDSETLIGTSSTVAVVPSSLKVKLGTQTQYGVPYGEGTSSAFSWTSAGTDGQLVIAATGAAPAFATLTSSDSSITVTGGANTLDITTGASVPDTFTTDSGNAVPAANVLQILGGTACSTSGATNVVTINVDSTVATSYPTDAGTATPAANALTIAGGTLLNTSGAAATVTINADDSVVGSVDSDSGTATPTSNAFTIAGTGGISTSGSGATITIDGSGVTTFTWNEVTGTSQSAAVNNGYITNNGALVTVTLPAAASIGDVVRVVGKGSGGWRIAQNAGQTIHFLGSDTTTGTGGRLDSTNRYDCVELLCFTANDDWIVISSMGNITVT